MSDANQRIVSIKIMPGSYIDRTCWNNSYIKAYMETLRINGNGEENFYLIGKNVNLPLFWNLLIVKHFSADSGYYSSSILLVHRVDAPASSPEFRFLQCLTHTRVNVEQMYGRIKNVWQCLKKVMTLCYQLILLNI